MKRRGLIVLALTTAVLAAVPAHARMLDRVVVADSTGDGAPDISKVTVSSNASGAVTFVTDIADRKELSANEFVYVLIDADNNAATGEAPKGVDYRLQLDSREAKLFRWSGTAWVDAQSGTVYGYVFNGFRLSVNKADLGMASNELHFWVRTQAGAASDELPNGANQAYSLSAAPLRLTVAGSAALAKTVKVGKQFAVGLQVHRNDLDELSSAGIVRCTAKVGKRAVKVFAGFPEDIPLCAGLAPKFAKGKTLKVTISLELDGQKVARTLSIKVR